MTLPLGWLLLSETEARARIYDSLRSCDTKTIKKIAKIFYTNIEKEKPPKRIQVKKGVAPVLRRERPGRPPKNAPDDRELAMKLLFDEGKSFQDIAGVYGVTRERVRQIFKNRFTQTAKNNIARYNKVTNAKMERGLAQLEKRREREIFRYARLFGCTRDLVEEINGGPFLRGRVWNNGPASAYVLQKTSAASRGIEWDMTFPEWWSLWENSGKYVERGRGKKYAMARYGDSGAYEIGNVYICTGVQNTADQYIWHPDRRSNNPKKAPRYKKDGVYCHVGHSYAEHGRTYLKNGRAQRYCGECRRLRREQKKKDLPVPAFGAAVNE